MRYLAHADDVVRNQRWLSVAALLVCLLWSLGARAANDDKSANDEIDRAITGRYLATDFSGAESALESVLASCAGKCGSVVMARAWMYLGIVRGSGKQDLSAAKEAFVQAVTLSPRIKIDPGLATPELKAAFEEIASSQATVKGKAEAALPNTSGAPLGGMVCTPTNSELQTHRLLPISCSTDQPATKAEIKYKEFGSTQWKVVQMGTAQGKWLGTIPCSATSLQGNLYWYVNAKDQSGEVIDNFASQRQPILVEVLENTAEPPPSFPGQPVPARCGIAGECPEEMLGTPACPGTVAPDRSKGSKTAGDTCNDNAECDTGLYCQKGTCSSAQSCERDSDCTSHKCVEFHCSVDESGTPPPAHDSLLNWLGLHLAADVALVSAKNVCASGDFLCLYDNGVRQGTLGESFTGSDTSAGEANSGFALGTLRILAAYERILTKKVGIEGRLGFAFNGAPSTGKLSFFPIHAEARAKYWFTGSPTATSPSPYVFAGGGVAQVDAKVNVVIRQNIDDCVASAECQETAEVRAYKRMGAGFVSAGGGAVIPFGPNIGLNLNLSAMLMLPKSGIVFEPALGFVYGF